MLDKTLPYFHVIMKRPRGAPVFEHALGGDFIWDEFEPGDESAWADIETAVGEFPSVDEARNYFERTYAFHGTELSRRCVFVRAPAGEKVGTVTTWWNQTGDRSDPSIHWLAVRPEYQGRGLGSALVSWAIGRLLTLEGERDIWIHTQTWSHEAIRIYLKAGFTFVRDESFGGYPNDYPEAMVVLHRVRGQ